MRGLSLFVFALSATVFSVASAQPVLITAPLTLNPGATTVTPTAGGAAVPLVTADITVDNTTLTVNGRFTIRNLSLEHNASIVHENAASFDYSGNGSDVVNGASLNVQANPTGGNVVIDSTSWINVSGRGFAADAGPGKGGRVEGQYGGGASHGGSGGKSSSFFVPAGSVYGSVSAPVTFGSGGGTYIAAYPGGGGGGAFRLQVSGTLTIEGSIMANGATGGDYSGGGSGGSLWLQATTLSGSGKIVASGGASYYGGGGGGGHIALQYVSSTFTGTTGAFGATAAYGQYGGAGSIVRTTDSGTPTLTFDNDGVTTGAPTALPSPFSFNGDVTISGGAQLGQVPGSEAGLVMTINGSLVIDASAAINMSGCGYAADSGPGKGGRVEGQYGGGGGHGGTGGKSSSFNLPGGIVYGSVSSPVTLGSGGGSYNATSLGGAGGGVLKLDVSRTLNVNGSIRADGAYGGDYSGGGSGGSLWIQSSSMTGTGNISASGGSSYYGGGGGGGRIALQYESSTFAGTTGAYGALSTYGECGGPGGIVRTISGGTPTLTFDNNGIANSAPTALPSPFVFQGNVMLSGGAQLGHATAFEGGLDFTVNGDLTIHPSASINVNGRGFASDTGSGKGGRVEGQYGGGGGHGGTGGKSSSFNLPGGSVYGSISAPTTLGSGGGSYSASFLGGAGGGAAKIHVSGALTINGSIRADGAYGGDYGGGGSGGSLWIQATSIAGNGSISASGGSSYYGGGGGGGHIALEYVSKTYSGTIAAFGAPATFGQYGGAGSVVRTVNSGTPLLTFDNSGFVQSAATVLPSPFVFNGNVTLSGGAQLGQAPGSSAGMAFTVNGDLMIDTTGAVNITGAGYSTDIGPGRGGRVEGQYGGGGGHGGTGGKSYSFNVAGGNAYGSASAPDTLGSGGGSYSAAYPGGGGGGAANLQVSGTLTVNGSIKADGGSGGDYSGGGSGGSLWIQATTIAGNGTISASGGSSYYGGSGGGGHIALYACAVTIDAAAIRVGGGASTFGEVGATGTLFIDDTAMYVTEQPSDQGLCVGNTATFGFQAVGATSYQWFKDSEPLTDGLSATGAIIAGSQSAALTVTNVNGNDSGLYTCVANGGCGDVASRVAVLNVCSADVSCDGFLTFEDFDEFVFAFESGDPRADFNLDGFLTFEDFDEFVAGFEAGC